MSSVPPLRNADRARRAPRQFVGRPAELDRLATAAREDGPVVTVVLGIGGIGKTSLLDALGERLDRAAVPWRRLDCESVEPTPTGLLAAIGASYCGSGGQRFKPAWSPKKPLFGISNVKWLSRIEVTDSRFEGPF